MIGSLNNMADNGKSSNTCMNAVERLHLGNKSGNAEDEMVTWLQYPLEYNVDRGYCSELFGSLSSSYGKAKRELYVNQGVSLSLEGGEKRAASTEPGNSEDALALGAGRVSGFVHSEGAEAFKKVKTVMQQTGSSPKKVSSDVNAAFSPLQAHHHAPSLRSGKLANAALMAENYNASGASHNSTSSRLWSSVSDVGATQVKQGAEPRKEAAGLLHLQGIRIRASDGPMLHAQGSSYSLVTLEDQMKGSSFHAACAGHWEPVKLAPFSKERHLQVTNDAEVVVPSCSVGSQTSGEMSAKETSSLGKQTLEDCDDYRSKNTEGDSAELSQLNKRRLKRSRVAESHNLSEKRRRNRINEKLKTLQELIPNSCKTDKASILDEAIDYLKALQSQLQMMSTRNGMRLPPVIMPVGVQHLQGVQMAPFHSMGIGLPLVNGSMAGMGLGLTQGIDGSPFQAFPTPHFNLTTVPVASPFVRQPYPGMELSSSEFLALQQAPAQESYKQSQGVLNAELSQHGENVSTLEVSKDGWVKC